MHAKSFAGIAVFAVFFLVFAGISQAGGMMHKSTGTGMAAQQTVADTQGQGIVYGENGPPAGYREALGAGALPASSVISSSESRGWKTDLGNGNFGENGPPAGVGDVFTR